MTPDLGTVFPGKPFNLHVLPFWDLGLLGGSESCQLFPHLHRFFGFSEVFFCYRVIHETKLREVIPQGLSCVAVQTGQSALKLPQSQRKGS